MSDYKRGYNDCKEGFAAEEGQGMEYLAGYGKRYQEEQIMAAKTEGDNK